MNIKETLEEISRLEKLQAQVELRMSQHAEEEKVLKAELDKFGIKEEELEAKMNTLAASITERLTFIKNATRVPGATE